MANQVAQTILAQLGGNKFLAMTGARDLVNHDDGLSFKVGRNDKKITHASVRLLGDLYDVECFRVRGTTIALVAKDERLYAHQLAPAFECATGLLVSL